MQRVLRFPPTGERCRLAFEPGGIGRLGRFVRVCGVSARVALVSDTHVARLYAPTALAALRRGGLAAHLLMVPAGERAKQPRHLERLWKHFARLGLERGDAVVALGGGVVGDLAGFAAATWLRGVVWINVPTSVVGQADSAIGGKTGINLAGGKNQAGCFHQPAGILVDPRLLATLPAREYRAGLAEVVKTAMVSDPVLFRRLERDAAALVRRESGPVHEVVRRAALAKVRIVLEDPRERPGGRRTSLNFGHTLGHGLEAALGYRRLRHGEAIAIGMRVAARLSERLVGLSAGERARLEALLDSLGLRARIPGVRLARLAAAMARDKKRRAGATRWVLTPRIGRASVPRLISARLVQAALLEAGARQ